MRVSVRRGAARTPVLDQRLPAQRLSVPLPRSGNDTKGPLREASLNETVKQALREAVERRRKDPEFKKRVRRIIEEDRELLERLAK